MHRTIFFPCWQIAWRPPRPASPRVHSMHRVLSFPWSQRLPPPHTMHLVLRFPCWQIAWRLPSLVYPCLHSMHRVLCFPCSQMLPAPHWMHLVLRCPCWQIASRLPRLVYPCAHSMHRVHCFPCSQTSRRLPRFLTALTPFGLPMPSRPLHPFIVAIVPRSPQTLREGAWVTPGGAHGQRDGSDRCVQSRETKQRDGALTWWLWLPRPPSCLVHAVWPTLRVGLLGRRAFSCNGKIERQGPSTVARGTRVAFLRSAGNLTRAYTGVHPLRGKAMFQIRNAANASKTVKRHDIACLERYMCRQVLQKYAPGRSHVEKRSTRPKSDLLAYARAAPPLYTEGPPMRA